MPYVYRDKEGIIRFRKVRNAPGREPRFFLQKWSGLGWERGTRGVDTSILYRAHEVAKAIADDREIFVVEGEKDADRLWSLGFAATSNAHGASEPDKAPKWKRKHSEQLRGADIVVLNDNDPPGVTHAKTICQLSVGVAKSVRCLVLADHWPDIGKGDDVSDWLDRGGGTRDRLAALIAAAPAMVPGPSGPDDNDGRKRPTIILEVGHTERIVHEIERLLIASDRRLFQRGSMIVTTGFAKMKTWDEKDVTVQVIEERGNHALLEDFECVADYQGRNRRGNLQPINPPTRLALTLKDRKSRLHLPVITGIVNCPSINIRGDLLDRPGYGADGVVFDPLGVEFPRVPDFPTKADALTALGRILRVLETFAFISDDDKAVATSGILTAVARRGLPFAPAHCFDAPVAGSGKSKIVDIITIIVTGRRAAVMDQGDEEEFRKAFGACLMRGDPMIAIDNCSHPVEGDLLNMSLTQEMVDVRILGQSKQVRVQTKAFVTLTGNNLNIVGDLTRRVVNRRLDPKCERPELSQFNFDPIAYVMENLPRLVTTASQSSKLITTPGGQTSSRACNRSNIGATPFAPPSSGSTKGTRFERWTGCGQTTKLCPTWSPFLPLGTTNLARKRCLQVR
jgi:hypothetical protein